MHVPSEAVGLAGWIDRLRENGWLPVPLTKGSKEPIPGVRWKTKRFTGQDFVNLAQGHGGIGIGLRLDELVVIDIDADDQARASRLRNLAELIVGETPAVRVGRYPRLALLYRAAPDVAAWRLQGLVECLTGSMYIVGFGIHPQTLKLYEWVGDGGTPLDITLDQIPAATADALEKFRIAIDPAPVSAPARRADGQVAMQACARQSAGCISDNRDEYLRDLVAAEIGRLKAQQKSLAERQIIEVVWRRFQAEADLRRPKGQGGGAWTIRDVERKVRYALRPSRSARINTAQAKGFWTFQRKLVLKALIDADRGRPEGRLGDDRSD